VYKEWYENKPVNNYHFVRNQGDIKLTQISKILVPHDGTEMSDKAFRKARELAKALSAELILLHVIEDTNVPPSLVLGNDMALINRAKRSVRRELERGWNKMIEIKTHEVENDNVQLSGECRYGSPAD
jgi:nucleotide-binding universal stress UspA family protein